MKSNTNTNKNNKEKHSDKLISIIRKHPVISSLLAIFGITALVNMFNPSLANNLKLLPETQIERTDDKESPYIGYSKDKELLDTLFGLLDNDAAYIANLKLLNSCLWENRGCI